MISVDLKELHPSQFNFQNPNYNDNNKPKKLWKGRKMVNEDKWIKSNDKQLIDSITRHEGNKNLIFCLSSVPSLCCYYGNSLIYKFLMSFEKSTKKSLESLLYKPLAKIKKRDNNVMEQSLCLIDSCKVKPVGDNIDKCKVNNTWPAYIDSVGLPTVGIGHLLTGNESYNCYEGVSDKNVEKQLASDIEQHLASAKIIASQYDMKIDDNYVVVRHEVA